MTELKGACLIGQSGGPTAVINASAYGVIKTGNCDGTVQHGNNPERETADRGVENRINGGALYAGFLRCDASGIPDHRI